MTLPLLPEKTTCTKTGVTKMSQQCLMHKYTKKTRELTWRGHQWWGWWCCVVCSRVLQQYSATPRHSPHYLHHCPPEKREEKAGEARPRVEPDCIDGQRGLWWAGPAGRWESGWARTAGPTLLPCCCFPHTVHKEELWLHPSWCHLVEQGKVNHLQSYVRKLVQYKHGKAFHSTSLINNDVCF